MNNVLDLNKKKKEKELQEMYKEQLIKMFILHSNADNWNDIAE